MNKRILLLEDESALVMTLTHRLASEGYEVESAADGELGLERALDGTSDLILLDVMLPGRDGFEVCRQIRERGIHTPVLMLTARGQITDKVVGFKLGADDYVTKPFDMAELLARIEALLRRAPAAPRPSADSFEFDAVAVNFERGEVVRDGRAIELSAREFKLLQYFIEHRGAVLSRETLLNEVWGYNAMPTTRTVDVHVAWLRQKLEPNPRYPRYILTLHGLGYKFVS
jgi:two-component system alkaline phosphatase synthesis response regulator PhoP